MWQIKCWIDSNEMLGQSCVNLSKFTEKERLERPEQSREALESRQWAGGSSASKGAFVNVCVLSFPVGFNSSSAVCKLSFLQGFNKNLCSNTGNLESTSTNITCRCCGTFLFSTSINTSFWNASCDDNRRISLLNSIILVKQWVTMCI